MHLIFISIEKNVYILSNICVVLIVFEVPSGYVAKAACLHDTFYNCERRLKI